MNGAWTRLRRAWRRLWQRARPHGVALPPPPRVAVDPGVGPDAAASWLRDALAPDGLPAAQRRIQLGRTLAPAARPGPSPPAPDRAAPLAAAGRDDALRRLAASVPGLRTAPTITALRAPTPRWTPPTREDWQRARRERAQQERR